jgi:hypothetical protein
MKSIQVLTQNNNKDGTLTATLLINTKFPIKVTFESGDDWELFASSLLSINMHLKDKIGGER